MFELQGSALMLPSDAPRGRAPQGGKVFFVHDLGDDSHEGNDPEYPLASITAALLKCGVSKGDYIFVQHTADSPYHSAINVNKGSVHLIGLGHGSYGPSNIIAGGQDAPAITLGVNSGGVEIAGFNLGSGTEQDEPAIELDGDTWYVHIHHNGLGTAIRALDGILIPAGMGFNFGSIDHNWFSRRLSGWGIKAGVPTATFTSSAILHNMFKMADGLGGVYLHGGEPEAVCFNTFGKKLGGDDGWAITLGGGGGYYCVDCMVMGNHAGETGDNTTGNNPYIDRSASSTATLLNFWAANYKGEALTAPATAT